jgi:hypothetical protein
MRKTQPLLASFPIVNRVIDERTKEGGNVLVAGIGNILGIGQQ